METFITLEEAYAYFAKRLGSEAWDCASETDKTKALCTASALINQLNFSGCKPNETQELHFPLNGETEIPADIKSATAELALELLKGRDPEMELEAQYLTDAEYGPVSSSYKREEIQPHILAGIPSLRAWRFLYKYLADPFSIRIDRSS